MKTSKTTNISPVKLENDKKINNPQQDKFSKVSLSKIS